MCLANRYAIYNDMPYNDCPARFEQRKYSDDISVISVLFVTSK